MILTNRQIREAIAEGHIIIDPSPDDDQFAPTAVDLRISDDIQRFKPDLYNTRGLNVNINLDDIELPDLRPHMEHLPRSEDGRVTIKPNELIIATTLEKIELPPTGKLAARVEGRSRFARLGLVVHMTAPTIHNTFRGKITLEIMNYGPIPLVLMPNHTKLCQLIFERISEEPIGSLNSPFQDQDNPLGSNEIV